jgi:hypothetical protein
VDATDPANPILTVSKAELALDNVNNTADLDKPISNLTSAALDTKSDTTHDHVTTYADINKNVRMYVAPGGEVYLTNDNTDPDPNA